MVRLRCLGCGFDVSWTPADPATGKFRCPECGREHTNAELSEAHLPRGTGGSDAVMTVNIVVWSCVCLLVAIVVVITRLV